MPHRYARCIQVMLTFRDKRSYEMIGPEKLFFFIASYVLPIIPLPLASHYHPTYL